jgi:hypothetical protein
MPRREGDGRVYYKAICGNIRRRNDNSVLPSLRIVA